jgi:hypothetical protein
MLASQSQSYSHGLSPRRVKAAPAVVLYELRVTRLAGGPRPERLMRAFEACARKWRGVARWCVQAHTSARGEAVVQVVVERGAGAGRVDNLFVSWRRAAGRVLKLPRGGAGVRRAAWAAAGGESVFLDARVMHEAFEGAAAKLWAEVAGAADAVRCSYVEPAMPPPAPAPAPPPALGPQGAAHAHAQAQSLAQAQAQAQAQAHAQVQPHGPQESRGSQAQAAVAQPQAAAQAGAALQGTARAAQQAEVAPRAGPAPAPLAAARAPPVLARDPPSSRMLALGPSAGR